MSELFNGIGTLQRALDYHLERHNVIASNVANVDTPGFRPQELLRVSEDSPGRTMQVARTSETHLSLPDASADGEVVTAEDSAVQPGLDGNSVSLEREMAKMSANDLRYEGASRIVAHHVGMLKYAANDGHGA